jgi:hypothetical protein
MAVAGGIEVPITLGGVREVRQQIKQLRGELINATDPAEVARLSDNIGQLSDKLKDANEKANVFASGSKFEQAGNAIGLMKSQIASLDFEGAGESAALFANRIKAINPAEFGTQIKGLVSIVGNLGKAFMSMGATLLMNPIFLIAVAIAAIVAAIGVLLNKLGLLKPILDAIGWVFEKIGEAIDWVIQKIKDFLDWIGLTNYAEQEAAQAAADAAEKKANAWESFGKKRIAAIDQAIRMDQLDGKNTTELELKKQFLIRQTARERIKALQLKYKAMVLSGDYDEEEIKKLKEDLAAQRDVVTQSINEGKYIRKKDAKERQEEEKKTSEASVKNAQDEAKRRADAYKKYRDDRIAVEREIQDLIIAGIRDDEAREKAEREARFTRQLEDIKKNEKYTADERLKLTNLLTLNYNAQVAAEEDARRQEELQKKKEFEDEKLKLEKEADMASLDAAATNADAQYAIVEGAAQKEVERVRMTEEEKLNALRGGFGAIGDLAEAWAGKDKARQKKAFQINKAMNIATATIDTYKGATAAYASAGGNPILGSIMAAIVVASGLANIAKIKATQFEGGGNAAPTSTASSATATPTAMQPTFNFQGSGNQANNLNSQNDLSMITVKAVVSESEVTSTQNQVSKYENSAKL